MTDRELPTAVIYGDGIHDDTAALQAFIDGSARVVYPDGSPFPDNEAARIDTPDASP